ncbi:MAG: TerD family protein [Sulfuritalea sp.]|nr:TerD family protein [Sulfuritalea sp.]
MHIVDRNSGHALCHFDLADVYGTETSMIFGEIYRYKNDWKFKAIGQGFSGGLAALCRQFGVEVN